VTLFDPILVPHDGLAEVAKALGCAAWLARELGTTLHVLSPGPLMLEHAQRARLVLHESEADPVPALLREIAAHAVKLVVMTARGESASAGVELSRRVGRVGQAIIERSPVPVILLPVRYREALPWRSMLVAASGERAADRALDAAVELANALRLAVTVAHCEQSEAAPLGAYADEPHHELAHRLEELIGRGLVARGAKEQDCIHEVLLCRGDPAAELLAVLERLPNAVLALGWHGSLASGRAPVLTRLLEQGTCPLLLVRATERSGVRLNVGEHIDQR
jgi:nucleotide-binding universal stress UspA family protein